MKITLYGATGMIGQRVLREALERGHTVTAIARDPSKVTEQSPNLSAQAGNVLDRSGIAHAVAGQDAVISASAPSGGQPPETLTEAAHSLIAGLTQAGVKRLVMVGGAGSLEIAPGVQLLDSGKIPEAWLPMVRAHRDALNILRTEADALDWTYFSPAALIEPGERTGTFRLGGDQLLTDADGSSRISAEDYAVALLDEIEKPAHIRQRFTAAY
jgi:putative NADH-flavin reductase